MRALFAISLLLPALAAGQNFRFNDKQGRDTVNFVLNAPFERINGLSNALRGEVKVEQDKISGSFQVPVNSIKTGLALRDEHLTNDRWLDAAKHPNILLTFSDVKLPAALETGKEITMTVEGEFTIRGVKRKEKLDVTATWFKASDQTKFRAPGDLLHVTATIKIPIEPYGIQRTQALLLKVGDVAHVTVDAWGSTEFPLATAQAAQP